VGKNQAKKTGWPQLSIADGTLEALKWLGLALMTGDHVNKYLFNGTLPVLFEVGRLAMPIFIFVLAVNLARPKRRESGSCQRVMMRLAIFGALSSIPFIALGGIYHGWWPLNILFTLLVLTATIFFIERGRPIIAAMAFTCSALTEFNVPAVLFGLAVWSYAKKPTLSELCLGLFACASLWIVNGNLWALAVLPLLAVATRIHLQVPRLRWLFYTYYPLHLSALWLIRIPMKQAGYLFF
jgi:hypothetical protein